MKVTTTFFLILFLLPLFKTGAQELYTPEGVRILKNKTYDNSDEVPDVVTTNGNFERITVVRMKQGTDLLAGLKKAVRKESIQNAVILSGIGSLVSYHIHVVDNNTFPTKNAFIQNDTPVDLVSVNGYVFDGRVHAHINISDERLALGGHLEPGNEVFTFAIITIGILNDEVNLERFDDKDWK